LISNSWYLEATAASAVSWIQVATFSLKELKALSLANRLQFRRHLSPFYTLEIYTKTLSLFGTRPQPEILQ
jgi:hypothetical protein